MCHDPQIFLEVQIISLSLQTCQNYGATMIWSGQSNYRCNRLRCPLARMSGLQCFNMGHNGHGINLYGVSMTRMGN